MSNPKLRERVEKLQSLVGVGGNPYVRGVQRVASIPSLSAYWPTPTPNPTPSSTPTTTNPTPTPTRTRPVPTPTISFSYDAYVTGPGESDTYLISFPNSGEGAVRDTLYITNSYTVQNQTHTMEIKINGAYRTTIDYDSGRTGTQFGYSRNTAQTGVIEAVKTFTNGEVNIVL